MTPLYGWHTLLRCGKRTAFLLICIALSTPSAPAQSASGQSFTPAASIGNSTGPRQGTHPAPPQGSGWAPATPPQFLPGADGSNPSPNSPGKPSLDTQNAPAEPANPYHPGEPLPPEQLKALVIVKGDFSTGTGFVAKMHDHYFIITNQHVLSGNKNFTMTGMDGTKYPTTGALYGAKDYDVAILQIPDSFAKYYLEIDSDPENDAKAHSPVTVPGNADGTGVAAQTDGVLVGIGPTKIEVTAKFIHGNSGSPIIYRPTGKVIGIATEVVITSMDELKKAADSSTHHWIGFRLDNIPAATGWVKLDWDRFSDQGVKLQQVDDVTEFLAEYLTTHKIPDTDDPDINRQIDIFSKSATAAINAKDESSFVLSIKLFIDQVQRIASDNLRSLSNQNLYPFHAIRLKEEQDIWSDLTPLIADVNNQAGQLMDSLLHHDRSIK